MGRKRKLELNSSLAHTNESSNSSGISHSSLSIIQRSAANDRERTRMRVLSKAFVKLKTSLPWVPADTKLSKLDTLKLATSYISYLTRILQDDENKLNINTQDIFQTTSINFQKFNINTRLFSNIRFSSNEKQKKIIENLASNNNNTINANFGVIGNNGIHNMNMNFAAKNSMSFHQNEHVILIFII